VQIAMNVHRLIFGVIAASLAATSFAQPRPAATPTVDKYGIYSEIVPPVTRIGLAIADPKTVVTLNLLPSDSLDFPHVLVDLDGEKRKEIPINENIGVKVEHPLLQTLTRLKAQRQDALRIVINAPADLRIFSYQLVLKDCAAAGLKEVYFATRVAANAPASLHFIPCPLPLRPFGKDAKPEELPPGSFDIVVRSRGAEGFQVSLAGGPQIAETALSKALDDQRKKLQAAGNAPDKAVVVVRARLNAQLQQFLSVYQTVIENKWPQIVISATND
jgi:biopolymer transport protein ExbD